MPYIRVNPSKIRNTADTLRVIERNIGKIEDSFCTAASALDWDVKREQDIDRLLRSISNEIAEEERMLRAMESFLDSTAVKYEELEHQSMGGAKVKKSSVWIVTVKSPKDFYSDLLEKVKNGVKLVSKLDDDDGDTEGFTADILAYAKDFVKMFVGGDDEESIGVRWWNLADSSCSVWKGFYEMLRDGMDDEKLKKAFEGKYGNAASAVGVAGSLSGFVGSYIQFWKTGEMDDYSDMLKSTVGVGKEMYSVIEKPDSGYGAHIYTSIIKSGIDFSVQIGESTRKYNEDGNLSWTEIGAIGVEASITGINTLISELTYKVVSLENIDSSPEKISDTVLSGAENWGEKAGEMIRDDPELKKEYDEGSSFKKTRMLLWAIGKTGKMYLQS